MKQNTPPLLLVPTLLLLLCDAAVGCVCGGDPHKPTPESARAALVKDVDGALAIFSGEVIELDALKLKFKIDKLWKGELGDEIVMSTGAKIIGDKTHGLSSCDYRFKKGEKYLVFAYSSRHEDVAEMQARECTRTKVLRYAEQEMVSLDELVPHEKKNVEPESMVVTDHFHQRRNLTTP